jgi:multicomponent Na+:H+ antiporter subunit B
MTRSLRLGLFLVGAVGLALLYALAIRGLPGEISSPYGEAVNALVVGQRRVTAAVSAVNFDYRGFDTLGEEFILFVSVMGALVLLRRTGDHDGEKGRPDAIHPQRDVPPSAALRVWILAMIGPKVLFGIYVVIHGQLTPGGGFQGGVILATVLLLIFLAEGFDAFQKITSFRGIEIVEAGAAAGYVLLGLLALFRGKEFLTNVLPLGRTGSLTSGGTIPAISLATGLEVATGFVLLLHGFLQDTFSREEESE